MFESVSSVGLERALDALALQQRVSAANVANAATPGYRAQKVDFRDSLAAAMRAGDPTRASTTIRPTGTPAGPDGNTVDLARELAGTTGLQYKAAAEAMTQHLLLWRTALGK